MLKRKALFLFCKGKEADFCFIQETHACKEDVLFWRSQWGSDMWFSFGVSNRTAGVAILKDKFSTGWQKFYNTFSDILAPFLLAVFKESVDFGELPASLKQGEITLIPKPKPNKDQLYLENWRPISLLNNDTNIYSHIFSKRLKKCLNMIIDEEQSVFLKGRYIGNNIRLILDLIDFISDDGLILFIDFYKAFDTIEHYFMFKVIAFFGFGMFFQKAIQTLYNGCNSSVQLTHGTCPRFNMGRGIRPISPLLVLLVVQVMATHIKKASFHGISVFDKDIKLSQLADDATMFVKNSEEVESVINCIGDFTEISGLKMNKSKSVLFSLKDCPLKEIKGIQIKDTVTYLGIVICKDLMQRYALQFEPIIEKIKNRYNAWLMRDLSLLGRILLSKAEVYSRSVYVSMSMEAPKNVVKDLDKILYDFIWKRKTHYLWKYILNNSKELGGSWSVKLYRPQRGI